MWRLKTSFGTKIASKRQKLFFGKSMERLKKTPFGTKIASRRQKLLLGKSVERFKNAFRYQNRIRKTEAVIKKDYGEIKKRLVVPKLHQEDRITLIKLNVKNWTFLLACDRRKLGEVLD